eukprot:4738010-Heterocapsa_arctica.AAC.1
MSCPAEVLRERVRDVVIGLHRIDGELAAPEAFLHPQMADLQVLHPARSALLQHSARRTGVGLYTQMCRKLHLREDAEDELS